MSNVIPFKKEGLEVKVSEVQQLVEQMIKDNPAELILIYRDSSGILVYITPGTSKLMAMGMCGYLTHCIGESTGD